MPQSLQPKTAIVFDFGGVLFDWKPFYLYAPYFNDDAEAVERFLVEIGFKEWNAHQDKGRSFAEAVAELSAKFPQHTELIRIYDERYEDSIKGVLQGSVEIMGQLKQAGYPLFGLTNWPAEKFQIVRPKYPFLDWLEDIVVSGEVRLAKPDPAIYAVLLERIGRPPGECLFIDDSETNIAAARRLGFNTILFESPEQLKSELQQRGIL
jgi:2-haloacid dehalogenase